MCRRALTQLIKRSLELDADHGSFSSVLSNGLRQPFVAFLIGWIVRKQVTRIAERNAAYRCSFRHTCTLWLARLMGRVKVNNNHSTRLALGDTAITTTGYSYNFSSSNVGNLIEPGVKGHGRAGHAILHHGR